MPPHEVQGEPPAVDQSQAPARQPLVDLFRWGGYGVRNLLALVGAFAIFVALPGDVESFRPSMVRLVDKMLPGYMLSDAAESIFGLSGVDVLESRVVPISRSSNQYIVFGRYMTESSTFYRDVYFVEQGVYQPLLHVTHTDEKYVVASVARDDSSGVYYFEGYTQGTGSFHAGAIAYRLTDGRVLQEIPVSYRLGMNEKVRWETFGSSVFMFTESDGSNGRVLFTPTAATISSSAGVPSIIGIPVLSISDAGTAMIGESEVESIKLSIGENLMIGKSVVPHEITGDAVQLIEIGGEFSLLRAVRPGTSGIQLNLAYHDPETEGALVQSSRTIEMKVFQNSANGR